MTLQRRVMLFLLLAAPLVWGVGLLFGVPHMRHEIDELFDTQQVQLARQMLAVLPSASLNTNAVSGPVAPRGALGAADTAELSIAAWNRQGHLLLADQKGAQLTYQPERVGFVDLSLNGRPWRVYYQRAASGEWLVAVGQLSKERKALLRAMLLGQLLPWMLTLPALLIAMALALRQALKPLRQLTAELQQRRPDDLKAVPDGDLPSDLKPLVHAMNGLLQRVGDQIEHERRFTADAAHELRTPLAALQAQWDAARLAPGRVPSASDAKISMGLERLGRLVTQMLSLSRLEHLKPQTEMAPIDWVPLVEQLFSDQLPLAEARHVELECEWPPQGTAPLLQRGDSHLLSLMLRNLLDNALRHSPPGGSVTLRLAADAIEVCDEGPGVPAEQRHRLGDRFFRLPGQTDSGSGLGLSIVQRIAELHGLALSWHDGGATGGTAPGFRVRLSQA